MLSESNHDKTEAMRPACPLFQHSKTSIATEACETLRAVVSILLSAIIQSKQKFKQNSKVPIPDWSGIIHLVFHSNVQSPVCSTGALKWGDLRLIVSKNCQGCVGGCVVSRGVSDPYWEIFMCSYKLSVWGDVGGYFRLETLLTSQPD